MNGETRGVTGRGRIFAMIIALSLNTVVAGQPCPLDNSSIAELSLAHAVDLAFCSNADIQAAAAAVRIQAAQLGEAHAEYSPTLAITATELHEYTQYPDDKTADSSDSALTVYGALSWRLFDFGGRRADSRAARKLLEAAMGSRDATVQKVLSAVVQAYFDAVTAKSLLQSQSEDVALARETLASARRRVQQGGGAQSDALQAMAAVAKATLSVNRTQGNYASALAVLAQQIGLAPETQYSVPNDVENPPAMVDRTLTAWLEEARLRHPAINAARADVEAAQAQVSAAQSAGLPTVDFQANYYKNGFPQQGLATARQNSTTLGISISIPVFDGFLKRYKIHEAEATVSLKQATQRGIEQSTLAEIVKAYSDAKATVSNLQVSQTLLESTQASEASSRRRYDAGIADILELLASQGALADARQERVRSLADWRSARLRLLAASGVLSSDDL